MNQFRTNSLIVILLLLILLPISCGVEAKTSVKKVDAEKLWTDSVMSKLTVREKIAQLIMPIVGVNGGLKANRAKIDKLVKDCKVGGIHIQTGSIEDYVEFLNYAQSVADVKLFISIDGEWGPNMRFTDLVNFPRNMSLGAIADNTLMYEFGAEVARECKLLGIHINCAPDIDVNTDPLNPVIGNRAFGENPTLVAAKGVAVAKGMEDNGVLTTAKHFPGHGSTLEDSHKTLPLVNKSRKMLENEDFVPFRDYINAGLSGVMVGHLNVPSIKKSKLPTSMQSEIYDILTKKMHFKGLIYTDALKMKGAKVNGSAALNALTAGAHVLLGGDDVEETINKIETAIQKKQLKLAVVDAACRKVLQYKYRARTYKFEPIEINGLLDKLNDDNAQLLNVKLNNAAITLVHNNGNAVPIVNVNRGKVVVYDTDKGVHTFIEKCKQYSDVKVLSPSDKVDESVETVIIPLKSNNQVSHFKAKHFSGKKVIVVVLTNPYSLKNESPLYNAENASLVFAYSDDLQSQKSAAEAIFGGIPMTARCPVTVPDICNAGDGVNTEATRLGHYTPEEAGVSRNLLTFVDELSKEGLLKGAFTGCQVLMVKDGKIICDRNFGYTDTDKKNEVDENSLFDLASVSKTIGTLPGVMLAVDKGLISIDSTVGEYVPEMQVDDKKDITVSDLLYHVSGMPPSLRMMDAVLVKNEDTQKFETRKDLISKSHNKKFNIKLCDRLYSQKCLYDTLMNRIYNINLITPKKYVYSCLNFCLLMRAEENVTHINHDMWVGDNIFSPLGASHTCYRAGDKFPLKQIVATEMDTIYRHQKMHGYVHDELACFSGGIQGNAGLFANANDIAKVCQMWLNDGVYGGIRVIGENTVKLFTTSKSSKGNRGLGFDKPTPFTKKDSSKTIATEAFGHTGFTGTIFWVDPVANFIYVFLSNRVNPTRDNKAFSELNIRTRLFRAFYDNLLGK